MGVSSIAGRQLTVGASALVGIGLDTIGVSANSPNFVQQGIAETNVQGVAAPEIGLCPSRLADNPPNVTTNSGNSSSVFGGFISFGKANSTLYTGAPENYTIAGDNTTWSIQLTSELLAWVFFYFPLINIVWQVLLLLVYRLAVQQQRLWILIHPSLVDLLMTSRRSLLWYLDLNLLRICQGTSLSVRLPSYYINTTTHTLYISLCQPSKYQHYNRGADILARRSQRHHIWSLAWRFIKMCCDYIRYGARPTMGFGRHISCTVLLYLSYQPVLTLCLQKNVYTILRMNPPSVGIAPLSPLALSFSAFSRDDMDQ